MTDYLTLTPTWSGLLPALLAVIKDHDKTPQGYAAAADCERELARMARLADHYADAVRNGELSGHPANVQPIA